MLGSLFVLAALSLGIGTTLPALLGGYSLLAVGLAMLAIGGVSIGGGLLLPAKTDEVYQPPSMGGQRLNSGIALPSSSTVVEESEDTGDYEDEADLAEEAKKIAGQSWEVVRMFASRDGGPWYLFLCIKNALGDRETLEVSEMHEDYLDYFFLKEDAKVTFTFSEESLNTDEGDPEEDEEPEEFVTDYLRVQNAS